ncbi:MAG: type II secretion system F family protein [Elusimicrobiota bacterium]
MILLFKLLAAVSLFCLFVSAALLTAMWASKLFSGRLPAGGRKQVTAKTKEILAAFRSALDDNPYSSKSRKIRAAAASAFFFALSIISGKIILAFTGAVLFFCLSGFYFKRRILRRQDIFETQLSEALTMITGSVKAGQSFVQALENTALNAKPPLSEELLLVLGRIKLGAPLNRALLEMSERNPGRELKLAVISINIARETGGNIGEMLVRVSHAISERKRIRGKINSLTSQGKASGVIMSAIPLVLLFALYFMSPETTGLLFTTVPGNLMLALAALMISIGAFFVKKITEIDI